MAPGGLLRRQPAPFHALSASARPRNNRDPSPCHALPCMHASVVGLVAANLSIISRAPIRQARSIRKTDAAFGDRRGARASVVNVGGVGFGGERGSLVQPPDSAEDLVIGEDGPSARAALAPAHARPVRGGTGEDRVERVRGRARAVQFDETQHAVIERGLTGAPEGHSGPQNRLPDSGVGVAGTIELPDSFGIPLRIEEIHTGDPPPPSTPAAVLTPLLSSCSTLSRWKLQDAREFLANRPASC